MYTFSQSTVVHYIVFSCRDVIQSNYLFRHCSDDTRLTQFVNRRSYDYCCCFRYNLETYGIDLICIVIVEEMLLILIILHQKYPLLSLVIETLAEMSHYLIYLDHV